MQRPFPVEFRRRAAALVRAGKLITTAAVELGVSADAIHNWVRQDQIDNRPGDVLLERKTRCDGWAGYRAALL